MSAVPIEPHHLPTPWIHESQLDDETRNAMPINVPAASWWRVLEDFGRGFPATHTEFAWIDDGALHFATVAGFTDASEADGVDETEVLDRRRIPFSTIQAVNLSLDGSHDTVTLTSGEIIDDWPAVMIRQHLH
jgi:hypothetical protein